MSVARRVVGPFALAALAAACASSPGEGEARKARSAIIDGKTSDAAQDAVVLVMHYDALQKGGGANGCTGTLLTPRLVLTARHCVSVTDPGAACGSDGKPIAGGVVLGNHKPDRLFFFTGVERPDFISGAGRAARGEKIFTTGVDNLCNNDIALVLLDAPIEGAKIAPVRLEGGPEKGEIITAVGWGITEETGEPPMRMQRADVKIVDVGPAEALGPAEFKTGEATCSGDSGGPALAESGAVLGVLSRGGNGSGVSGVDNCLGAENIFTSATAHADVIREAYAEAGQEPWIEGQPNPLLAKLGGACASDEACQSSVCNLGAKVCSQDCSSAACPDGWACEDQGGRRVCAESPADDGGCSASGRGASSGWLFALAVALALRAGRARA